jgi:hypothetical protein
MSYSGESLILNSGITHFFLGGKEGAILAILPFFQFFWGDASD